MQKTIGGDRLGSGKKMKVELHNYERSTHDLGYIWRSTMASGTLVPFLKEVALPGDTFDINLNCEILTHPTIGPLFGSYKVQLDVFQAPIRLYQGLLHNNALNIGLNMANVKLPIIKLFMDPALGTLIPIDNTQINPSCILSYLDIRGVGTANPTEPGIVSRNFNGIPLLAYWDIYKNYYANKQEEIGMVIHTPNEALIETIDSITWGGAAAPTTITGYETVLINFTGSTPRLDQIRIQTSTGSWLANEILSSVSVGPGLWTLTWQFYRTGTVTVQSWSYIAQNELPANVPGLVSFPLDSIDEMRNAIMGDTGSSTPFLINDAWTIGTGSPYDLLLNWVDDRTTYMGSQEGLGIKTYQSDLFNNWLQTEWIDGIGGINEITAVSTAGDSFQIDSLILARKVYDMLNRIAVSGGTYDDWLDAVYMHPRYWNCTTPVYHGGLIKELIFQEVVSNSQSNASGDNPNQPLGTLAGRGKLSGKHKGGNISIKVDEPSYIIGIISLTPRLDYSQGNKWDTGLLTMDDFHKPALDEIGFQELIEEQMAWWTTFKTLGIEEWIQKSAGKQPAWLNYMTNVNQVRGNFAIQDNEMFMTLNRKYELGGGEGTIQDLTTYIDPAKFNSIFAQTSIDSQNFWTQISVDITARRKMSAKIMPNL